MSPRRKQLRHRRLTRFERLEERQLLVGEVIAIELDVTQNGQSILDANRHFQAEVGERFDLKVRYDDLRAAPNREGAFSIFTDIIASFPDTVRPVVHEVQIFEFSDNFLDATGGNLVVGRVGSAETVSVPLASLDSSSLATAAAQVLGLPSASLTVRLLPDLFAIVDFVDDSLAFQDIANLTFDTSGLTGANVTVTASEIPVFVGNNPSAAINPSAVISAIDFRSTSLNNLAIYDQVQSATYAASGPAILEDAGGLGSLFQSVRDRFGDLGLTFTGQDIHAFSIRFEVTRAQSGVQFTASFADDPDDAFIGLYSSGGIDVLTSDEVLFDTTDDSAVPGDDRFALVIGDFSSVVSRPYQNPNNRFDVNGDGEDGSAGALPALRDFNELNLELTQHNFSDPVTGKLPDIAPAPVMSFVDINGDGFVNDADLAELQQFLGITPRFDFGDAPTATQSGRVFSYPTTLADNGARHAPGTLRLGAAIDDEEDGIPSANATGDDLDAANNDGPDDEDGVIALTSILTGTSAPATASFQITSSGVGKIDAWIDFNSDGDWDDTNERVFSGADVGIGANVLSFTVPVSAVAGTTFARFRLTSGGIATPTGEAPDGEVEDHAITIVDAAVNADVSASVADGTVVSRTANEIVIKIGSTDVLRLPVADVNELSLTSQSGNGILSLDFGGGVFVPTGGLIVDGGAGNNTLEIGGAGAAVNISAAGNVVARRFQVLELSDSAQAVVTLDAAAVAALSPQNKTVRVVAHRSAASNDDRLVFTDATDWRMTAPIVTNNKFLQTATNTLSGEKIEADVPHSWQNLINVSDVDNSGDVSAGDALRIINELGRRAFSDSVTQILKDPLTVTPWPGAYFDQNGDDQVTALDALRVINRLAIVASRGESIGATTPMFERASFDRAIIDWDFDDSRKQPFFETTEVPKKIGIKV